MYMATPHINAEEGSIAKTVLMPGDPLRAKFIAENFLEEGYKQINTVRGMLGFTGTYKGKEVTVMGSGMGMPSIGIYSYELFKFYDVENIIRIGSCGAYHEDLELFDVILAEDAWSESSFAKVIGVSDKDALEPTKELNDKIEACAKELNIDYRKCRIHSSDAFYRKDGSVFNKLRDEHGCMAVEMESFALFANAMLTGKKAACILTVSDSLVKESYTTSEEREKSFTKMMELALEVV